MTFAAVVNDTGIITVKFPFCLIYSDQAVDHVYFFPRVLLIKTVFCKALEQQELSCTSWPSYSQQHCPQVISSTAATSSSSSVPPVLPVQRIRILHCKPHTTLILN